MKEMDRLAALLFPADGSQKVSDVKFFVGEEPSTVEGFARDVHHAFVQVNSGTVPALESFSEVCPRVHVDKFLAG